jgi:uncharacterized protein HemY
MFRLATTRGIAKLDRAWSVWTLPRTIPDSRGGEGTPRDLVPIIRELSEKVPAIVTVSTTLTAEEMASMNETIDEVDVAAEHSLRAAIRSGEAQAAELRQLASLLERRADYRESERVARAAVGMDDSSAEGWEILGRALLKQEAYGDARDALEMASSLDPTLVLALMMLATCYERLQDDVRAREVWTRAATLTGGEFLK